MTAISEKVTALVRTMCATDEYRTYRRLQRKLDADDELRGRVDAYRRDRMDAERDGEDVFARTDEVRRRYDALLAEPGVRAYLDAENAVCRMIREVCSVISAEVPVRLPEDW